MIRRRSSGRTEALTSPPEADTIKRLLGETPFLNPQYYLPIDLRSLIQRAHASPDSKEKVILSWDSFKAHRHEEVSSSLLGKMGLLEKYFNDEETFIFDELMTSANFLQQLPIDAFQTTHLEEHLSRFEACCGRVFQDLHLQRDELGFITHESQSISAIQALILPILRWSHYHSQKKWAERFVTRIEETIEKVQASIGCLKMPCRGHFSCLGFGPR
jgi:hypothetical protein